MMRIITLSIAALALTVPAQAAMTWYLTKQWLDKGSRFCQYGNGTVLNVGYKVCPLSIQG